MNEKPVLLNRIAGFVNGSNLLARTTAELLTLAGEIGFLAPDPVLGEPIEKREERTLMAACCYVFRALPPAYWLFQNGTGYYVYVTDVSVAFLPIPAEAFGT